MKDIFYSFIITCAIIALLTSCGTGKDMAVYGSTMIDVKIVGTDCNPCGKYRTDKVTLTKDGSTFTYNLNSSLVASADNVLALSKQLGVDNKVDVVILNDEVKTITLSRNRK